MNSLNPLQFFLYTVDSKRHSGDLIYDMTPTGTESCATWRLATFQRASRAT